MTEHEALSLRVGDEVQITHSVAQRLGLLPHRRSTVAEVTFDHEVDGREGKVGVFLEQFSMVPWWADELERIIDDQSPSPNLFERGMQEVKGR